MQKNGYFSKKNHAKYSKYVIRLIMRYPWLWASLKMGPLGKVNSALGPSARGQNWLCLRIPFSNDGLVRGISLAHSFLPKVDRSKCSQLKGETIVSLRLMVAIITGHNFFGGQLNKLNYNFSPMCNLCQNEIETSYHIYNGWSETAHLKPKDNASPGAILHFFSDKYYLREPN